MSKQQGYQSLNTEVPNGPEDYGFAARLPQAGGSHPTDCARDADLTGTGTSGGAGVQYPAVHGGSGGAGVPYPAAYPATYPAAAYAGAPVTGYPAMPMGASPMGMVVHDPLGIYGRNACAANGCRGCRGCGRRRGGPVHLVFRMARSAYNSAQKHHRKSKQTPAPARSEAHLRNSP